MRDSALKHGDLALQRLALERVGNELMRDSALKRSGSRAIRPLRIWLEMSSCATAL